METHGPLDDSIPAVSPPPSDRSQYFENRQRAMIGDPATSLYRELCVEDLSIRARLSRLGPATKCGLRLPGDTSNLSCEWWTEHWEEHAHGSDVLFLKKQ
ncbi:hypothetical protein I7I53_11496 [Histoplasma capsulatum var. duboisii H88]|uniref:Uncharacterized protein n=1 Tax=Ajellomyces capsulatus (strain H88) TaxID=544711 RepID=A0A8A1LCZ2_AJEC8|nr:hypothetical protein I7I53_11496 [Histoplasma capsulatum var. duboisii H88]